MVNRCTDNAGHVGLQLRRVVGDEFFDYGIQLIVSDAFAQATG